MSFFLTLAVNTRQSFLNIADNHALKATVPLMPAVFSAIRSCHKDPFKKAAE
jgi:hypothetical protein